MRNRRLLGRGALTVLVCAGAVIMVFPFLWTLITSITPEGSLAGGPSLVVRNPTLDAYRELFTSLPMMRIIANSILVSVVTTGLQLLTGAMAGYGFARLEFRAKGLLFALYLATMMIPLQVLVVPLFIMFKDLPRRWRQPSVRSCCARRSRPCRESLTRLPRSTAQVI